MLDIDVRKIFASFLTDNDTIVLPNKAEVTVEDFLNIAGFKDCDPTKSAMLAFDDGRKGYASIIELGDFS